MISGQGPLADADCQATGLSKARKKGAKVPAKKK
jgi:hypothetical protein